MDVVFFLRRRSRRRRCCCYRCMSSVALKYIYGKMWFILLLSEWLLWLVNELNTNEETILHKQQNNNNQREIYRQSNVNSFSLGFCLFLTFFNRLNAPFVIKYSLFLHRGLDEHAKKCKGFQGLERIKQVSCVFFLCFSLFFSIMHI